MTSKFEFNYELTLYLLFYQCIHLILPITMMTVAQDPHRLRVVVVMVVMVTVVTIAGMATMTAVALPGQQMLNRLKTVTTHRLDSLQL